MAAALFRREKYTTLSNSNMKQPGRKKEIPQGVCDKCPGCGEMIITKQKEENLDLCPRCSYHYPMTAPARIAMLTDPGSFKETDASLSSVDALKFEGAASYAEKLVSNQAKTGMRDAIVCGSAKLNSIDYALGVMDFRFLGASMGSVVGEKVARITEFATERGLPLAIVTASGGARMYEGMLSLMQMAKTSGALQRHAAAGLPYIVLMTHPTMAGVTASFASLGDIILAEPGALIGFAGTRVIKDTTQSKLPDSFQTAEFLMKKGMIDRIIDRKNLRREFALCLEYMSSPAKVRSGKAEKAK
jgi:acetyl-CoA carboxylase carboxyl transferase subunit beta